MSITIRENVTAPNLFGSVNLGHLKEITTKYGIWQHCEGSEPDAVHGFDIDDDARALIIAVELWRREIDLNYAEELGGACLTFLEEAELPNGRFHNFANQDGGWVDSIGSDDSFGRTLWALAVAYAADTPFAPRARVEKIMQRALPVIGTLESPRAKAFSLIALSLTGLDDRLASQLIDELVDAYNAHRGDDWHWFEDYMTYCNARFPYALLMAGRLSQDPANTMRVALESLDFLLSVCWQSDFEGYSPVGNENWFKRGEHKPAVYDQQPVDAGVLVEACSLAYHVTGDTKYRRAALAGFDWYHGRNIKRTPIYDPETGGVCDAITAYGLNCNQGAESILSYCLACIALDNALIS